MQKAVIILLFLFLFSCKNLQDSKVDYNEILFLSSEVDRAISFNYIEEIFSESLYTPTQEFLYKTKWIKPDEFKKYLNYRNLIFISIAEPKDSTIDILVDNFRSSYKEDIFMLNDVYAKNQALLLLSFKDSIDMVNTLSANQNWILYNIDENISKNMDFYMYRNGRNIDLEKKIDEYYNLNTKIQNDYMVIKDHFLDDKFIWIGRGYPYRWITIEKNNYLDEGIIWYDFKESISKNMPNVKIVDYYKNILYESDDIIKIQGLYEEEFSDSGGPFLSYVWIDRNLQETFFVTGFVNNPGKSKARLLKEMEIQIKNIIINDENEK